MQETQVQPLCWEDPLEEETATNSSTVASESHRQWSLVGYNPQSCKELDMTDANTPLYVKWALMLIQVIVGRALVLTFSLILRY